MIVHFVKILCNILVYNENVILKRHISKEKWYYKLRQTLQQFIKASIFFKEIRTLPLLLMLSMWMFFIFLAFFLKGTFAGHIIFHYIKPFSKTIYSLQKMLWIFCLCKFKRYLKFKSCALMEFDWNITWQVVIIKLFVNWSYP